MLSKLAVLASYYFSIRFKRWERDAIRLQGKVFSNLIAKGKTTQFGIEHRFNQIKTYEDFKKNVPIRDYEATKPYIDKIISGEKSVLWPGKPLYFAKTSGTTSGAKYIPITRNSMPNHINTARLALLMYIYKTRRTDFIDGKYIFISGSPELDHKGIIPTGRLSGIVNHHVPSYVKRNQLPTYKTNCIADWETKLDYIVKETIPHRMSLISGIPPWVEMYFERIIRATGKQSISEVFPNFSLFVYGGVNFKPYQQRFKELIGKEIDSIETFPASEGFFAFQDEFPSQGLLLIPDSGIFYEFIPVDNFSEPYPQRLSLEEVELNQNYALVVSTNAGLWAYNIGDTVRFVSKNPYRIEVTGRLNHYTSAFGEHVIAQEVEDAIDEACKMYNAQILEFTVAPLVLNPNGLPCHEWFIEFSRLPNDFCAFQEFLDLQMQQRNPYYKDLIAGNVLQPLKVHILQSGAFVKYMKSIGKLGGQNKVPHLKNDRSIADQLIENL
jgi:hypothetical protein